MFEVPLPFLTPEPLLPRTIQQQQLLCGEAWRLTWSADLDAAVRDGALVRTSVVAALEAEQVLLEANAAFQPHALLGGFDGCPTGFAHTRDNLTGGQKGVTVGNALHGLASEDRGRIAAQFVIGQFVAGLEERSPRI